MIKVNGKEELLVEPLTILDYLLAKGVASNQVIVVHNNQVIKRNLWRETLLRNGDLLEILEMLGGG